MGVGRYPTPFSVDKKTGSLMGTLVILHGWVFYAGADFDGVAFCLEQIRVLGRFLLSE